MQVLCINITPEFILPTQKNRLSEDSYMYTSLRAETVFFCIFAVLCP